MGKTDIKIETALDAIADYAQQYCDDNSLPIGIETDDRYEDRIMLVITMDKKVSDMTKYNHMMDVAFTIETEEEDWTKLTTDELIGALQRRIHYLQRNLEDAAGAFGHSDSYEIKE